MPKLRTLLVPLILSAFFMMPALSTDAIIAVDNSSQTPLSLLNKASQQFSFFGEAQNQLLPPEQAFPFSAYINEGSVFLNWQTAQGYYLYRDKISVSLQQPNPIKLAKLVLPEGQLKQDEIFGETQVYYGPLELKQKLIIDPSKEATNSVKLLVHYQGCAEIGVCYPPMTQAVNLVLPSTQDSQQRSENSELTESAFIAQSIANDSIFWVSLSFLGFGLMLAFTPCVFPMIPILSGIIIGQGNTLTVKKGFLLSLSYVSASAITYALFGVIAGMFGSNLQASFQNPWIISAFSLVFVALALSMFGLYQLQLPSAIQSKLTALGHRHNSGSFINAAIMGFLSALIIGPCVAAPLAGALIYIGQTADALLGGFALFSLGIGMGTPLLVIGLSAGKLLPKAGLWMNPVKYFFGVLLIAVAITLIDRIIAANTTLYLWAVLTIICAVYLRTNTATLSGWHTLRRGIGSVLLVYGTLLLIGAAAGGINPLQPLAALNLSSQKQVSSLEFRLIQTPAALQSALLQAKQNKQLVMLDFYADWCVSCKEMEHNAFSSLTVKEAVKDMQLLQIDVTKNTAIDRQLLKKFNLIGPPAILFFSANGDEIQNKRVIGYKNTADFTQHLNSLPAS